jgi:hypothetical protein
MIVAYDSNFFNETACAHQNPSRHKHKVAQLWWGLGFRVSVLGIRVQGSGFRVQGLGFRVWGSGWMESWSHPPSFRATKLNQLSHQTGVQKEYSTEGDGNHQTALHYEYQKQGCHTSTRTTKSRSTKDTVSGLLEKEVVGHVTHPPVARHPQIRRPLPRPDVPAVGLALAL